MQPDGLQVICFQDRGSLESCEDFHIEYRLLQTWIYHAQQEKDGGGKV